MSLVLRVGVESDEAMRSIMGGLPSARLRSCPRLPDQLDRWPCTRWRAATDGHPARPAPTSLGRRPARHGWAPGRPHADVCRTTWCAVPTDCRGYQVERA